MVDMTHAVAGSFSTRFLADCGADVIKLESYSRPDGFYPPDAIHILPGRVIMSVFRGTTAIFSYAD